MRIKMGTSVPKMGTIVHLGADQAAYRKAIADTLRRELGPTHQAIKTVMRWTGASERTAKYWLSGERGPSGEHLIRLAQGRVSEVVEIVWRRNLRVNQHPPNRRRQPPGRSRHEAEYR